MSFFVKAVNVFSVSWIFLGFSYFKIKNIFKLQKMSQGQRLVNVFIYGSWDPYPYSDIPCCEKLNQKALYICRLSMTIAGIKFRHSKLEGSLKTARNPRSSRWLIKPDLNCPFNIWLGSTVKKCILKARNWFKYKFHSCLYHISVILYS